MSFRTGDTVGDYEIVGLLGSGGMGRVFRVRNLISDRVEAMKIVLPDAAADSGLADRFLREIKVHASLEHPNIATMRTALRVEDRIVMIMELVEGASLAEVLRRGPVDLRTAISYASQVLAALAYAHARDVVHRDIKPANIIVTPEGVVKVTDFGIARAGGAKRLTVTGTAPGSLFYMSPEQIQGTAPDARSDLYSLGVTFYEMLTGVQPIRGENEYAVMRAHLTEEPVPPSELAPSIPAEVSTVILKAMAKLPEHRFQSADEFQAALRALGEQAPGPAPALTRTIVASSLDATQVSRIESHLTRAVGPIARHMISKATRRATSLEELCRLLAEQVSDARERDAFLRSCAGGSTATRSGSATGGTAALNPALLEETKRKLAPFMGPLASILVDRTARKVRTAAELHTALAAEIPSERDRAAFLASVAG